MAKTVTTIPATLSRFTAMPINSTKKRRVAAYARVSTDQDEQLTSYEAQVDYYTNYIKSRDDWEFVAIYADEGITGTNTKHRDGFKRMVADALNGKIDLIITKSVSRFARNTVDSLSTIRQLKEKNIECYFEKENIFTTDSSGEFLLTLMSSLAQEESRSISENVAWGQRKRLADGKVSIAYSRFLGYDKGPEKYTMVINKAQAAIVRRIFFLFLQGYTSGKIALILSSEGIMTPSGGNVWCSSTISSILSNEKYKGDALLQKEFTIDYLQKKLKKNEGELPQYYVEDDHEAIISPWLFDYVQEQIKNRSKVIGRYSSTTLLSSKIFCEICGEMYHSRPWHSTSYNNLVWQCKRRTKKGEKCRCPNIYDKLLHYIVHDAARVFLYKRGVQYAVADTVITIVGETRADKVKQWIREFKKCDIWTAWSDENDIAIVLRSITVMPNGELKIRWLDDMQTTYMLPKYSPKGGIKKQQESRVLLPERRSI